ncbi:hypothetical protein Cfor_01168 [Coptotermes formosanus]|uniref:Uncharacterized protein n=1 Tax=Coptotermes formosanus TaxID=36987 RepID=A0A6L2PTG5_COPFO|nr:hypothetical protein Cfor_01168 [Coptotermes formosanus]
MIGANGGICHLLALKIELNGEFFTGPLMYCWFPCYGGSCGGYPLPQNPPSGGSLSWWFGFQFQWSRNKPRQGYPCRSGSRNRRRKGC